MPAGRPNTYRPAFCDEVINLMASGLSLTAAMAELGYHRQTAYDWAESHPEFSDAIALGHAKRSLFLERQGIAADSGPKVTFVLAALKNCNRDDFRDKQEIEHTGKDGGPIETVTRIERAIVKHGPDASD